jgi:protein-disulfide isomerase
MNFKIPDPYDYRKEAMRRILNFILITLLTVSTMAATPLAAQNTRPSLMTRQEKSATGLPTEDTVNSFLQQTFGYEKDLTWKIASITPSTIPGLAQVDVVLASPQGQQLSRFYVGSDGAHAIVGDIIPFGAKPFDPAKKLLEKGISGPERGPKDAVVTIVEFGDLQCPACKAAQPNIEGLIAAEPNARFVFQNFPLEMHNWAAKGAAYADCVAHASSDAFWKFIAKTYETQQDIVSTNADEKLTAIADGVGLKGSDIAACAAKPETKAHVDASIELGKSVEVTGTPTLFINGRKVGNVSQIPADTLKNLVEFFSNDAKKSSTP